MRLLRIIHYSVCGLVLVGLSAPALVAQVSVLTQHNDTSRTGQNLQETVLNASALNVANFGKLFSLPVTGNIFAQPLYVSGLTIGGGTHNVVYVATAENNVYAFDADSGNTTPLWTVGQNDLGTPVPSDDICGSPGCYTDVIPVIGILATPVIDAVSETIYVVANSKDTSGKYHFKLHALDLTTGAEKFAGPAEVTASEFNPLTELCRPGLLLVNGTVYVGFGSVGDFSTWHGFVMGYDASTLQQVAVYNSTPQHNDVGGAGIWQTGNGLVTDASGDIYAVTSNGNFDVNTGGQDYGSAYLKLSGRTLSVLDYFVPYNQQYLNPETYNVDLGSGGPLLIPNTTLLVGGGKDAVLRLVDTTSMGHFNALQNSNHQNILGATNPPMFGSPVYWDSPNLGPLIYLWGQGDYAKAWSFNATTSLLSTTPAMESTFQGTPGWNDQAALSISASGSTAGTGILWASMPYSGISNPGPVPGVLYALDATNLQTMLWSSQLNASRDAVGNYAKFAPPTVANGKVYLATFSDQLLVYGTFAPPDFKVTAAPSSQSVGAGSSASYIAYVSPQGGFTGTVDVTCSGLPSGASCSAASVSVPPGSGQVSAQFTVTTATSTAGGSVNFTITGTSGTLVRSTTANLTVMGFALTATPLVPATITVGGSATSTVTVAPSGGFNSTVNLTCAITPVTSAPPRCSFSSANVSGGRGTPTLTVSTVGATASVWPNRSGGMYYATLLPLCGLTLLARFGSQSRKGRRWMRLCLLLTGLVWLAACGGGSPGGGGGGGGTTTGSYTVTVSGTSGALTQTQTLALTVQ